MSKYDFGYDIERSKTNEWAFEGIEPHSKVLELGASTGLLTKHLREDKQCSIDIVEVDEEAGQKASKYADISVIGRRGDLNETEWYENLKKRTYDYIVILDVLEHLHCPELALSIVKRCLKPEGKVLLSVPNIAHNAVLLQLLKDNFQYTNLGLLDNTHVHFFTYKSLYEMLTSQGFAIEKWEVVNKEVSETEIPVSYDDVSQVQSYLLKSREHGSAYQYLLTLSLNSDETKSKKMPPREKNVYLAQIMVNGSIALLIKKEVTFSDSSMEVDIAKYDRVQSIRFIPYQSNALIIGLKAWASNQSKHILLKHNWTTGVNMGESAVLFHCTSTYEINYLIPENCSKFYVEWKCIPLLSPLGDEIADELQKHLMVEQQTLQKKDEIIKNAFDLSDRLNNERDIALQKNAQLDMSIGAMQSKIDKYQHLVASFEKEKGNFSDQIEKMQVEISKYRKQIESLENRNAEQKILANEINRHLELCQKSNALLKEENNTAHKTIRQKEAEYKVLQDQFDFVTQNIGNWTRYKLRKLLQKE